MAWEKPKKTCLGHELISRPGEYEWSVSGAKWVYRFGGGLLTRNGRPIINLTASLPHAVRWTQGYEWGHQDGREL